MTDEPTDRKLTERQQRVLEAAMEVFAERGFAAASTAEIAKRAGVAEGTIFKQYKTKKELLLGVVAPLFIRFVAPELTADVKAILRRPYERFEDLVRDLYANRIAFVRSHSRAVRIALQELPFQAELRALAKEMVTQEVLPDAFAMIARFQALGQIRDGEPTAILRLIVGTFATYALTSILISPDAAWDDERELALMVSFVARGLRGDP